MGEKRCMACGIYKPLTDFYKHAGSSDGLKHKCRPCYAVGAKAYRETDKGRETCRKKNGVWRSKNLEKARELSRLGNIKGRASDPRRFKSYGLQYRYKISLVEYEALLARQGGKCAICGTLEPGGVGAFHVDHKHTTGEVRGLLCGECNMGLGKFADNPDRLSAAISYLAEGSTES